MAWNKGRRGKFRVKLTKKNRPFGTGDFFLGERNTETAARRSIVRHGRPGDDYEIIDRKSNKTFAKGTITKNYAPGAKRYGFKATEDR
jgi:hypothetical protein